MRIEFLTQDDPLYVFPFFEEFVCSYASEFEIIQISCSPTMGKRSRMQMLKELTQLYGVWGMGRLLSRLIRSKVLGALPKRMGAGKYASLSQLCQTYRIACARIGNPNGQKFVDEVRRRSPDVLVSVACPFILKQPLLSIASRGSINIHHAPLPRYRGMMPTFWQMYHGERTTGLTIHSMVEKLDQGEALLQEEQPIQPGESLDHLIRRSKRHGAHCMAKVLRQIADNSIEPSVLDHARDSYFTFPTAAEIHEFRRRGLKAI
jgi:methionyl-tRNA formyltransferase